MSRPIILPHTDIPIIKGRLNFSILKLAPRNTSRQFCYTVDHDENFFYQPFFSDFGPPSLLLLHRFMEMTDQILREHQEPVLFFCSHVPQKIANAAMFVCFYKMVRQGVTPDEAFAPIKNLSTYLKPYRDACPLPSSYDLTVLNCLKGIYHAMQLKWYNPDTFDENDWEYYEQVENGDMNWIIPNKMLAFASPYQENVIQGGWRVCTPEDLVPIFQEKHITHIIRLCQPFYDKTPFIEAGIKHTELYFQDGSTPPDHILRKFLAIVDTPDVIALHCKAGLGRTGTLIACFLIRDYGFNGHEAIAWLRVCRPGSVIGPQQNYVLRYYELTRPAVLQPPKPMSMSPRPRRAASQVNTHTHRYGQSGQVTPRGDRDNKTQAAPKGVISHPRTDRDRTPRGIVSNKRSNSSLDRAPSNSNSTPRGGVFNSTPRGGGGGGSGIRTTPVTPRGVSSGVAPPRPLVPHQNRTPRRIGERAPERRSQSVISRTPDRRPPPPEDLTLEIRAVSLTPKRPQPRKYNRAPIGRR